MSNSSAPFFNRNAVTDFRRSTSLASMRFPGTISSPSGLLFFPSCTSSLSVRRVFSTCHRRGTTSDRFLGPRRTLDRKHVHRDAFSPGTITVFGPSFSEDSAIDRIERLLLGAKRFRPQHGVQDSPNSSPSPTVRRDVQLGAAQKTPFRLVRVRSPLLAGIMQVPFTCQPCGRLEGK